MPDRPKDWTPLGLTADPTPGNADKVRELITYTADIRDKSRTINDGLKSIMGTVAGDHAFVGKTAEKLPKYLSEDLNRFLTHLHDSMDLANGALVRYLVDIEHYQSVADGARTAAINLNLPNNDPQVLAQKALAEGAHADLAAAGAVASGKLDDARGQVTQPLSDSQLFWEAFGIIALILMIPAILFGGVFGVLAFVVNLVVLFKTAVDFFQGKASFLELFLAFLGVLGPTTQGLLPILKGLVKTLFTKGTWIGIKNGFVGFFSGLGMLRELSGLGRLPFYGGIVLLGGLAVLRFDRWLPQLVWGGLKFGAGAVWSGLKMIPGALKNDKWLRIFLPLDGREIGQFGLKGAFAQGVLVRGLGFGSHSLPVANLMQHGTVDAVKAGMAKAGLGLGGEVTLHLHGFAPTPLAAGLGEHGLAPVGRNFAVTPGQFSALLGRGAGTLDSGMFANFAKPELLWVPKGLDAGAALGDARVSLGHADAVLELRNPSELSALSRGDLVVLHTDKLSLVVKFDGLGTVPAAAPGRLGAPARALPDLPAARIAPAATPSAPTMPAVSAVQAHETISLLVRPADDAGRDLAGIGGKGFDRSDAGSPAPERIALRPVDHDLPGGATPLTRALERADATPGLPTRFLDGEGLLRGADPWAYGRFGAEENRALSKVVALELQENGPASAKSLARLLADARNPHAPRLRGGAPDAWVPDARVPDLERAGNRGRVDGYEGGYTEGRHGGFQLTQADGQFRAYDAAGRMTQRRELWTFGDGAGHRTHNVDRLTGTLLEYPERGTLRIDELTGSGRFSDVGGGPGYPGRPELFPDTGGFRLTDHATGDYRHYDRTGTVTEERTYRTGPVELLERRVDFTFGAATGHDLFDGAGATTFTRVDFPSGTRLEIRGTDGVLTRADGTVERGTAALTRDEAGRGFALTDPATGAVARFDGTGTLLERQVTIAANVHTVTAYDHAGLPADVRTDFHEADGALAARLDHGTGDLTGPTGTRIETGATVRVDAAGDCTVTVGLPRGESRTYRPTTGGTPVSSRHAIGGGDFYQLDHTTNTWQRYHGDVASTGWLDAGTVAFRRDGDFRLAHPYLGQVFERETVANGNLVHARKDVDGRWTWQERDAAGDLLREGRRRYDTNPSVYHDTVGSLPFDRVRSYRKTVASGGLVRADRGDNGAWTWHRLDATGAEIGTGPRTHRGATLLDRWEDRLAPTGGRPGAVAQENPSGGYREHAAGPDGTFSEVKYVQHSALGKEVEARVPTPDGGTLTWTRLHEQRPPSLRWQYTVGRMDFPKSGFMTDDSLYQVFRWVERGADGNQLTSGVRVTRPDGSWQDFTRDGHLVRETRKLENGRTVKVGVDARGDWLPSADALVRIAPGGQGLHWIESGTPPRTGTRRFVDGGPHWRDEHVVGTDTHVVRETVTVPGEGHFPGADREFRGAVREYGGPYTVRNPTDDLLRGEEWVTKSSYGQILERGDRWGGDVISASGHPRTGDWRWTGDGGEGLRYSARNRMYEGSWDNSFWDTGRITDPDGTVRIVPIRDYRVLREGTAIKAVRDPAGTWTWTDQAGNTGVREWWDGTRWVADVPPAGTANGKLPPWRDLDAADLPVREIKGGLVRQYRGGDESLWARTREWADHIQGGEYRSMAARPGGRLLEQDGVNGQFRLYEELGPNDLRLLAERHYDGRIHADGVQVGRGGDHRGILTEFRGTLRTQRESNRVHLVGADLTGAGTAVRSEWAKSWQKVGSEALQEFLLDFTVTFAVNAIVTAASGKDFTWDNLAKAGISAGFGAGLKGMSSLAHDRLPFLKSTRDGLANIDGGRNWNRHPYNNEKTWDLEMAGVDSANRWRVGSYDYGVATLVVNPLATFLSGSVNAYLYGKDRNGNRLSWDDAMKVGGMGALGGLVWSAPKALVLTSAGGRLWRRQGLADILANGGWKFGEKAFGGFVWTPKVGPILLPTLYKP